MQARLDHGRRTGISAIFGIINKNGKPVDPLLLQKMEAAMLAWGPDGRSVWHNGPAGLGQLLLHNTPESVNEQLPRRDAHQPWVLTAAARIDNRASLCDMLNIAHPQRLQTPDSELLLRAYEKWAGDCARHILGDYAFAIWHPAEQTLFLARDHHGCTALYYYDNDQFFAFATSIHALLALPEIPQKLNEKRLAQTMLTILGDAQPTYHEGINYLLSAHTLRLTPQSLIITRFWKPEDLPTLKLKSAADYAAGLREVLDNAVRSQLRSHRAVGIALSSGLDSTAVAAFAAPALKEQGLNLTAYSWIPAYEERTAHGNRLLNERPLVDKVVAAFDNIELHYLGSKRYGIVDSIHKSLDHCPRPSFAPGNMYWHHEMWDLAKAGGIGTVLNGRAGNMTISWVGLPSSVGLANLLRQGRWKEALAYNFFYPLFPDYYRRHKTDELQRTIIQQRGINPEFAARLDMLELFRQGAHTAFFHDWKDARQTRCNILMIGHNVLDAMTAEIIGPYALEWRDPTAHVSVIEYTLSIPDHIFAGKTGGERRLVRLAMQELLPPEIVWNRRRGLQSSDIVPRMWADSPAIEDVLYSFSKDAAVQSYIDVPRISAAWQRIKTGTIDCIGLEEKTLVLGGIRNGLFLQKYFPNGA